MAGGIISGFLDGAGRAAADYGRMTLANDITKERDEANFLRDKELKKSARDFTTSERVAGQEFTSGENTKKLKAKEKIAKNKQKQSGNKPTSNIKNVRFLMSKEGGSKPLKEAVMLSFPGSKIKHTDEEGNISVAIPDGKGGFEGVFKWQQDENGKPVLLNEGEVLPNAKVEKQHRAKASENADKKAKYGNLDATDFPSTGGDRGLWRKREAQRIANEERSGGIINSQLKPKESKPDTSEPEMKTIGTRRISKNDYIEKMVKKYGKDKLGQIERQWLEYSAGN